MPDFPQPDFPQQGAPRNKATLRGWITFLAATLGLFTGLCTLFALVVTAAQAWQEHTRAHWPETTAQVQQCNLTIYTRRRELYWIDCSVRYTVRGEDLVAHIHSRSTPAPRHVIAQYPANQFESMQDWVDDHPEGTPITVHYDPANHGKAVLVNSDMPLGGPQTPTNLKLLCFFGVSCIVLVTIARTARPRPVTPKN